MVRETKQPKCVLAIGVGVGLAFLAVYDQEKEALIDERSQ